MQTVEIRVAWQSSSLCNTLKRCLRMGRASEGTTAFFMNLGKQDSAPELHQKSLGPEDGRDVRLLAASQSPVFFSYSGKECQILAGHPCKSDWISFFFFFFNMRGKQTFGARVWEWVMFPSPGDLPDPGIKPGSPASQADSLPAEPSGKPLRLLS